MTLTTSGIDYTFECAFGIDPLDVPGGGDWVDITEYVRGFSTRRGRNHELGKTAAGVCSITLDNRDRRFDPTFADANIIPLQNQQDVEVALAANTFAAISGATVVRTTTAGQFSQGIAGLSITAHATNTNSGATVGAASGTTNVIPVDENQTYTFAVQLKGSGAHTFYLRARWLDSGGTAISNTDGPNTVVGAGAFAKYTHTATAPATAAFVRFQILYPAAGAAQVMYADEFQAQFGTASTAWPAAAPYYPNVVPMTPLRIEATYAAVTYPVFYGFVEDWGQTWPGPAANAQGDAFIELQAVDAFKVFNMIALTSYPAAVRADSPVAYYRLNGGSTQAEGSDDLTGTFEGDLVLEAGPLIASGDVPDFTAAYVALPDASAFDDLADKTMTVEAWIRPESVGSGSRVVFGDDVFYLTTDTGNDLLFGYDSASPSDTPQVTALNVLTANTWYHVACVRDWDLGTQTIYLNGAEVATASFGRASTGTSRSEYTISSDFPIFPGRIAHVAFYAAALTENAIAAHYAAGLDAFENVTSGDAVDHVLDAIGWPVGLRDLDAGVSTVTVDPTGSALDVLGDIAEETEHGILVMGPDNTVTFIDRAALYSGLTAAATFGDSTGETPYRDLKLSYDDQDLWTEVTASSEAGSATVTDAAAAARYGLRSLETSGSAATLNEVAAVAQGLLDRYKAPAVRPVTLQLNKPAAFAEMLGREIGDRVTIKRRPPGGGVISTDAIIEGIDHDAGPDGWLTTTFALVPVDAEVFWILADATYGVLGETTRLGW